jgi:hypothetical protein
MHTLVFKAAMANTMIGQQPVATCRSGNREQANIHSDLSHVSVGEGS